MYRIKYIPSKSHWIVPPIIIGILVFLLAIMLLKRIVKAKKNNEPLLNLKSYSFFEKNWDKIKLLGGLLLFVGYIYAMEIAGFLGASIVCIFLFNILFTGSMRGKSLLNSVLISVLFPVGIWFLFGQVFQITLP